MADDNNPNRIEVEIVLDDGSIQRGFAKFKDAAEKAGKESGDKLKTIGDVLDTDLVGKAKKVFLDLPVALSGVAIAAVAAGIALKEAFDLTIEGEKIKSVEVQFQSLSRQAGVSGSEFESALQKSADGLISTNDLLKLANGAIIELGQSASKLPQVLEITRRATAALGGSLEERFQAVVQAIETGNVRLLRSQGIILDQKKAFEEYAKTLGVSAGSLTKAQEQQAILNAYLDQAGEKFRNVQTGITPATIATKQFTVAMSELGDAITKIAADNLGGFFAKMKQDSTAAIESITANLVGLFGSGVEKSKAQVKALEIELSNLQLTLQSQKNSMLDATILEQTQARISKVTAELEALRSSVQKFPEASADGKAGDQAKLSEEQLLERRQNADKILQLQIQSQNAQIEAQKAFNQNIIDQDQQRVADQDVLGQELEQLQIARNEALLKINDEFSQKKGFTDEQRRQAEVATEQQFDAKIRVLNDKFVQDQKAKYVSLASVARSVFANELGGAFQAFGAALAKGQDAASAFGKAMIGIFGDIAIQLGNFFIAKGIALSADPLMPGSGAGLIAAGAALNVLGGALKAIGGGAGVGGGGDTSSGGVAGDSGIGGGSDLVGLTPEAQRERQAKDSLVVNINGDVLGDEGSGKRLVALINSAFDVSGVQLRQGLT